MLRSMTGFGRCLVEDDDFIQQWEIKSVNGRYFDLRWHLPFAVRSLEPALEKIVRKQARRGRIEITLSLRRNASKALSASLNMDEAEAMLDALERLASDRGDAFEPDYAALLNVPSLWSSLDDNMDEEVSARLEEGLNLAIEDWNEARCAEGQSTGTDIVSHVLRMEEWLALLEERAPGIKEERQSSLRERIAEALQTAGYEPDEGRLLQEIVILADKLDVSEELSRLKSHLERLRDLLETGHDAGKRLDFTLQECFREINTCGNKLQDAQLSRLVVEFKNELEKCREQAQNLE